MLSRGVGQALSPPASAPGPSPQPHTRQEGLLSLTGGQSHSDTQHQSAGSGTHLLRSKRH